MLKSATSRAQSGGTVGLWGTQDGDLSQTSSGGALVVVVVVVVGAGEHTAPTQPRHRRQQQARERERMSQVGIVFNFLWQFGRGRGTDPRYFQLIKNTSRTQDRGACYYNISRAINEIFNRRRSTYD